MNRVQLSSLVLTTFILTSFAKSKTTLNTNEIYGCYANNSGVLEAETLVINLFQDKSYSLTFSECPLKIDSGVYHTVKDTLYLSPTKKFDKIISCIDTGINSQSAKLIIDNGRLKLVGIKDTLASFFTLTKQGQKSDIKNLLTNEGSGYLRIIDSNNNTLEEGYFKEYKIYNGVKYLYEDFPKEIDLSKLGNGVEIRQVRTITKFVVKDGIEQ